MMMRDPIKHYTENIEPQIVTTLQEALSGQLTETEITKRNTFVNDFLFNAQP